MGKGAHGDVHLGETLDGDFVALKILSEEEDNYSVSSTAIEIEAKTLQ